MEFGTTRESPALSGFALASSILASLAWIFMLTFTYHGREVGLLPTGEARLAVGGILSGLAFVFFWCSLPGLRSGRHHGWLAAGVGLGISSAVLSIVIPVLLMLAGS